MRKRFRIAFSFSGEKRDFVSKVARVLADRFGEERILYDKYHAAEFARSNLAFHLPALYNEQADLVVVVLCKSYGGKEWCGLEWSAINSLIKKREESALMLSRFDQVQPEGLFELAGFIDLDDKSPEETVTLILERLAINEGQHKDYYSATRATDLDWPDLAPPLDWPVADHSTLLLSSLPAMRLSVSFRYMVAAKPASHTSLSNSSVMRSRSRV